AALHELLAEPLEGLPFSVREVIRAPGFFRDHPVEGVELHLVKRLVSVLLPPLPRRLPPLAEHGVRIPRAKARAGSVVGGSAALPAAVGLELVGEDLPANLANALVQERAGRADLGGHAVALVPP